MKEIRDIILAYDEAEQRGESTALATVVHVDGSSYRRPGARMLITEKGNLTGAISGGCLEGDALRKALLVLMDKKSRLVTYDTSDEDDAKLGLGLGCNGIIQVLIEPIDAAKKKNPIQLLKQVVARRQRTVLITLFSLENKSDPRAGTFLLLKEDNSIEEPEREIPFRSAILQEAGKAMLSRSSSFKNYTSANDHITSFIEFMKPPIALVIIGAGNDVIPMVNIATVLGWEVTVVDGRADYAQGDRFVSSRRVFASKPENVLENISIDEQTAFVLMTHNYNYDMAMLRELLKNRVAYIGVLGPRKKLDRILHELQDKGENLVEQPSSVVYGPAGLELGAETPEEIALSILSEIKAVLSGKQGGSLRNKPGVIHSPSETMIEYITVGEKT